MNITPSLLHNIPEFSVSELAFSLKRTLEENYARVRVRGELSSVSIPASGHLYTKLKDKDAIIDAVCWKGTLSKLGIRPEEGLEVICTGRITTYPARSNYQLIIESLELAGEGALLKLLEERKKKLAAEGLFDAARKRKLPFLPERIGIVTSPTGAVIRDILHRLADRFPRPVLLWPVLVQGEGAETQIASAIEGFNLLPPEMRPDLLIVARGGGSLEDLMPFNGENVVRAAAQSHIPLISAVGHETDTTLIDFAADLRAPTPTAAAEMAVPRREQLITQINDCHIRLNNALRRNIIERHQILQTLNAKLERPERLLEIKSQRLDFTSEKLMRVFSSFIALKEKKFMTQVLRPPQSLVREKTLQTQRASENLHKALPRIIDKKLQTLENFGKMLELLSFENVLARGYVVVRDGENDAPLTDINLLSPQQSISLQFKNQKRAKAKIN